MSPSLCLVVGCGSLSVLWCGCGQHVCFFVLVSFRPVSASSLHTLRCFQVWSINPVVCGGPYPSKRVRILVLE